VARYCPAQFLEYHKCLGAGDASKCFDEQKKLGECVKKDVPSFVKILKDCSDKMQKYEACVRANPDFRSKCFDLLQDMRKCSSESLGIKQDHNHGL
jgi:hypothetical protein